MSEQEAWRKIMAYVAENKIEKALEAELQQNMIIGTIAKDGVEPINKEPEEVMVEGQRLDCIYDDETLGFAKDPSHLTEKIQAQDHLEEIDLVDGSVKRPTYTSSKIVPEWKVQTIALLKNIKIVLRGITMKCLG